MQHHPSLYKSILTIRDNPAFTLDLETRFSYSEPMKQTSPTLYPLLAVATLAGLTSLAEADTPPSPQAGSNDTQEIVVTARKWTESIQSVPGAVTVQNAATLESRHASDLREAAATVPNMTLGDFSVRRLTFPYLRGVGSGRNSPAVTTVIDGVPQLSYATANQEWVEVDHVEFLRGAQGALYGRNALGGVINVVPQLPTRTPSGWVSAGAGSKGLIDTRARITGPVGDDDAGSLYAGYSTRGGMTRNDLTGNRLDNRESFFGGGQVYCPGEDPWSFRLSLTGEADRDGDYALSDLAGLRANPYHLSHDYEGHSDRDLLQPVFTAIRHGDQVDITSISAFQGWRSHDLTDLDTTAADLIRRDNREEQQGYIEELRLSSPQKSPVELGRRASLRWLAGGMAYYSAYSQHAFNDYRPMSVPLLGLPFSYQSHDDAALDDTGASLFGHATVTLLERADISAGVRGDVEHRTADLSQYASPALMPANALHDSGTYNQVTPQGSLGYHFTPDVLAYVSASEGYKSGGFNTMPIPGHAAFGNETSWTYETGLKTEWFEHHATANLALFRTEWEDLQMDVPAGTPGVFYIDNTGKASSQGIETELGLHPVSGLTLFGGAGLLDSELAQGSTAGGVEVGGRELPFAPHATWNAGIEYSQSLCHQATGFARIEEVGTSRYFYDAVNGASQEAYALANATLGIATGSWRIEGWVKNAFDKDTIPLAFPYALAPSGYIGENGTPRTFGVTVKRRF